jgi:hypothetical protein
MSFYATIQGSVRYPNKEAFDAAHKLLTDGYWINEDGMFLDECDAVIENDMTEPSVNPATLTITFPCFCYRNLARILDDLLKGTVGRVCWTSTDGCLEGGYFTDGVHTGHNLEEWIVEQGDSPDDKPDPEKDLDEYCEWLGNIEDAYHEAYA